MKINSFKINGRANIAATDSRSLHFSMRKEGKNENICFEIFAGSELCWSSGMLPWEPEMHFEDLPLEPRSKYTVKAKPENGDAAELRLYTGFMGEEWEAGWIEPEQDNAIPERDIMFFEQFVPMPDHFGGHGRLRPAQGLRRCFELDSIPEKALLFCSAHGVYSLSVNGKTVDSRRLAPETSPYERVLYYQVYDIARLLKSGENTISVLLGDGWWIGRIGLTGHSCQYGDRLGFIAQLELETNGEKRRIVSDALFESRESFIKYSDLMMGEKWDLRETDESWKACVEVEHDKGILAIQEAEPVAAWSAIEPVRLFRSPKNELIADFGECLAGVVELRVNCPEGREITLDHSETLDAEGNFFRNILGRNKDQQDKLVCGEGESFFCPLFTYHGFRYLRIEGASENEIMSLRALKIGTPIDELGDFECSHEGLNLFQRNIRNSTRSNMVSVPTDCPQREKVGWTGDIQVFAETGAFNYSLADFLRHWLGQMRLSQEANGSVPIVIPSYPEQTKMQLKTNGWNSSSAWSDACVLVPLRLYKATGDKRLLSDNLEMMEKWMEYIASMSHDYVWSEGYHFGDWMIPSHENDIEGGSAVTAPVIAACQYAVTAAAYAEVLEILGESEEKIERGRELAENIRRAVRERFIHEDGSVEGGLQGLYVMALHSGAASGELGKKTADKLAAMIEENGGALDTGFVSTPHLLDVLTEYGKKELAYKLLYREDCPSWLYQVKNGATSIWENWNAIRPDGTITTSSYNHYALGCAGDWIYRNIGGLKSKAPGWSGIEYSPDLDCGLSYARCSHATPYGLAECSWSIADGKTKVCITVPHGVKAYCVLPGISKELSAGKHEFCL